MKKINCASNTSTISTRKKIAGYLIFSALIILTVILSAIIVIAADDIIKNEKAQMDFTDSNATGTVKINVVAKTDKKVKVSIDKGDLKYTYDLKGDGKIESFPLQWGNGEYNVRVMIQASDPTKYSVALTQKYKLELKDEKAPYMNANQLVNYSKDSKVVKKAAELTKNCKTELEKVEAIYKFVIDSLEYDSKKANEVQAGYLPSVDAIVDSKKGICFDYAAVLAAMLRSQGIPAKLVMGYVKVPDQKDPVYHAWNEFYLTDKGWFKVNEMKFDGKKFERVDPTFDSSNKSNKSVIKFIGDGSNYSKSWEF
ncbi:MAG: transglutaminase-like domain-containing protein [Oscillospiraceae bacterium]|nr:transglutaminase-like domain-containing protein [Oscillospiraceae bacterium]